MVIIETNPNQGNYDDDAEFDKFLVRLERELQARGIEAICRQCPEDTTRVIGEIDDDLLNEAWTAADESAWLDD